MRSILPLAGPPPTQSPAPSPIVLIAGNDGNSWLFVSFYFFYKGITIVAMVLVVIVTIVVAVVIVKRKQSSYTCEVKSC